MTEPLPDFARDWMAQWRQAAKELARIRAAELRQLRASDQLDAMGLLDICPGSPPNPHDSGLVIQQKWFIRQRLLQLAAEEPNSGGIAQASPISD